MHFTYAHLRTCTGYNCYAHAQFSIPKIGARFLRSCHALIAGHHAGYTIVCLTVGNIGVQLSPVRALVGRYPRSYVGGYRSMPVRCHLWRWL